MANTTHKQDIRHCELCGREAPLTFHHLVPRKMHRRTYFRKHYSREELITCPSDIAMFNAQRCESASLISNLRFLCTLRLILIAIWIVAAGAAWAGLGMALPVAPLGAVLALWTLLGLATYRRLNLPRRVSESELFVQLLVDVAALTALLYYSGGATNPLISLYLLPLVAAATVLPPGYAWAVAGITASGYTVLLFYFLPLPYGEHGFSLHVMGMWLTFVLSAILIVYFMVRMARALQEQDRPPCPGSGAGSARSAGSGRGYPGGGDSP
jgi:hypothetical protein